MLSALFISLCIQYNLLHAFMKNAVYTIKHRRRVVFRAGLIGLRNNSRLELLNYLYLFHHYTFAHCLHVEGTVTLFFTQAAVHDFAYVLRMRLYVISIFDSMAEMPVEDSHVLVVGVRR